MEENPGLAEWYSVISLPTLLVFDQGAVAKTIIGFKSRSTLLEQLAGFLPVTS